MGKGQHRDRDRSSRRRGSDDDSYSPRDAREARQARPFGPSAPMREAAAAQGPAISARVKMFNTEKGFGFVELVDGSGDAFVHIAVLQAGGFDAPAPGTTLKVQIGQGQKGKQVTAVLELDASTAGPMRPRSGPRPEGPRPNRVDPESATPLDGTVKWFNAEKGYGFVQADDGGKDVFVHISVVEGAGLKTLAEGALVSMRVTETRKGREAVSVALRA